MSRSEMAVAAVVVACLLAGPAGAVSFDSQVIDPNGPSRVWGKGSGDLDGDGLADAIVGSYDGGLYWYKNPGWSKRTISATAHIEEDIDVVDVDGDGRQDVVAVTTAGATWFRNTATGWQARVLLSGVDLHDITLSDFDHDGLRDIVGRGQGAAGNKIYLWRQRSLTSWARSVIDLPAGGEGLGVRDLDRDGYPDVVIGRYWLRNQSTPGSLSFTRHTYNLAAAANAYVSIGDINGDKRIDIVTAPAEPNNQRYRISWFEAPADPTDGPWPEHVIQDNVETVHHFVGAVDADLDGDLDVFSALTHLGDSPKVKLFVNRDGKGDFGAPRILAYTSSHSMKFLRVGQDAGLSLFGADYGNAGATAIRLFRWRAD